MTRLTGTHRVRSFATAVALTAALAASLGAQARLPPPVEARVPKPPTVAVGDSGAFLVYELHVTNFGAQPFTLTRLEVIGESDSRSLLTLADSALEQPLARPGVAPPPAVGERARIGGGLRAVAFLWVPVDARAPPASIRHRLTIAPSSAPSDSGRARPPHTFETAIVPVTRDVAVIGPPLKGGPWLAANGPANQSGHRRSLVPVNGTPAIGQRFAIDYVKLDTTNRTNNGDRLKNETYYAHGVDAIAVADGVVASAKDSIPENVPGPMSRAVPITLETVGGNCVIIDIGNGRYAFYAHLKPGSLRVRRGDRVRRGQVLGLVGNTGNSTEPHLHFHLSDANSPLGSEGIPYAHETLEVLGRCRMLGAACDRHAPKTRRRSMPMGGEVVRFPE